MAVIARVNAQTQDETAVRNVLATQQDAWNRGDIDAFMKGYWKSDSLLFVGKTGPGYGWQNTLDSYKKRYPDTAAMGKLQFTLLQVNPLGTEYYFVLGQWQLQRSIGDIGGYFTLTFRKIKGRWAIVVDHTNQNSN
jgi:ketosteroid isomerase-like protein